MRVKDLPVGSYFLFRTGSILELWYKINDLVELNNMWVMHIWNNQPGGYVVGHKYTLHSHVEVEGPIEMDFYIKDKFVGRT